MDEGMLEQLGIGALVLIVGITGWVLPYRWNLLRLRRVFSGLVSEQTNRKIPKIIGSVLIIAGLAAVVATLSGVKFSPDV